MMFNVTFDFDRCGNEAMATMAFTNRKQEGGDDQHLLLKIGEVSKLSGVGIEALRFYEKSGLLNRPARTGSGYRLYHREVLDRLAFIKKAQMLGFSLNEVKQIIAESAAGQSPCRGVREVVRQRLQELDERMAQMRRYRKELSTVLEEWEEVEESRGHVCGLIERADIQHTLSASDSIADRKAHRRKRDVRKKNNIR
jgi:DNA-binding transcriptional MerR regulator